MLPKITCCCCKKKLQICIYCNGHGEYYSNDVLTKCTGCNGTGTTKE